MESHHHHLHLHHNIAVNVDPAGDRFPQWSIQETRDFLVIRAELDQSFMETKRNKLLWDVISTKMREKGYNRSAEQCKCKWKNLVTRYKGCETMESEAMRQQFPFYNELQAIFTGRMQKMLWIETEGGGGGTKKKGVVQLSSEEEEENEESDGEKGGGSRKRRKAAKGSGTNPGPSSSGSGSINSLKEVLEEFMKHHMQMEMEWIKQYEAREEERKMREMEWRQQMEALEKERQMMERRWREREEERRTREEARAERRDALITALLNKLTREDQM